ncbi:hypothetical protein CBL_10502 [Carabus blaptoides fortunei]
MCVCVPWDGDNAELFRNRKGFFSFNVQNICNAEHKILDIVARWPWSSHDTTIFNNLNIRAKFEFKDKVIVAESGYQNRLEEVQCLIVATAVLNNIAIEQNDDDPPSLDEEVDNVVNFVNHFGAVHGPARRR